MGAAQPASKARTRGWGAVREVQRASAGRGCGVEDNICISFIKKLK